MLPRILPALVLLLLTHLKYETGWAWTSHCRRSGASVQRKAAPRNTPPANLQDFCIRDCSYAELGQVADIIMPSFYVNTTNPWKQFYRMGELNRIQQSFPHADKEQHRMLVAVFNQSLDSRINRIVGFCDIDARKADRPTFYRYNPRPYLSDLCIHPEFRRMGIARALVEACEDFCIRELSQKELFIRVEKKNVAAQTMYQNMGYVRIKDNHTRSGDPILINKKFKHKLDAIRKEGELQLKDAIQQQGSS